MSKPKRRVREHLGGVDKEVAQMILMTAARASVELGNLAPLLNRHGAIAANDPTKLALGSAIYEIGLLIDQVFKGHPELQIEFDARRKQFGSAYY